MFSHFDFPICFLHPSSWEKRGSDSIEKAHVKAFKFSIILSRSLVEEKVIFHKKEAESEAKKTFLDNANEKTQISSPQSTRQIKFVRSISCTHHSREGSLGRRTLKNGIAGAGDEQNSKKEQFFFLCLAYKENFFSIARQNKGGRKLEF